MDKLADQLVECNRLRQETLKLNKEVVELQEQLGRSKKMSEHWDSKERPLRRTDLDNNVIISRYLGGDTAYRIAKDLGVGNMTIISRLKRAGVYKSKVGEV